MLLTLIGGGLRFGWIDRPAIWGDESATLGRVCGSYQDLLDRLQYDGFGPLHYEAYWWIAKGFPYSFETKIEPVRLLNLPRRRGAPSPTTQPTEKRWLYPTHSLTAPVVMTPFVMRFIPALAGTLMIPAMYFLAVQLTNRRVALIAATFTAFSAYLLNYSRDAKMYMHLWLACTLSIACMIWWMRCAKPEHGGQPGLRPYRRIAWLGWLASSITMVGLHATGLAILGLEILFLVTHLSLHHRQWRRSFTGLAVIFIAGSGWLVHWVGFSKLMDRVERNGYWEVGIFWVDTYNRERGGDDLVKFTTSAFAFSWEWPPKSQIEIIPERTYKAFTLSGYVLLGIALVSMFPWRRRVALPRRGETQMMPRLPNAWEREAGTSQVSIVSLFFLLAWLIIPAYAMYCKSIADFYTPWQILQSNLVHIELFWHYSTSAKILLIAIPAIALLWSFISSRNWKLWLIRTGMILLVLLIIVLICRSIYAVLLAKYLTAIAEKKGWPSVWMPRYVGYLWPPFAIIAAILISRLPTRPIRGVVIAFLIGVNLLNYSWRIIESEPPTDKIAMDVLASQPADSKVRTYVQVRQNNMGAPGGGAVNSIAWRYYMIVYGHVKASPLEMRMFGVPSIDNKIVIRQNISPQFIVNDLKKASQVDRILVWDKVPAGWRDPNADDRLRKALGFTWRKVSEQTYTTWDHWTWQEFFTARRREYIRTSITPEPPTTRPTTASRGVPLQAD